MPGGITHTVLHAFVTSCRLRIGLPPAPFNRGDLFILHVALPHSSVEELCHVPLNWQYHDLFNQAPIDGYWVVSRFYFHDNVSLTFLWNPTFGLEDCRAVYGAQLSQVIPRNLALEDFQGTREDHPLLPSSLTSLQETLLGASIHHQLTMYQVLTVCQAHIGSSCSSSLNFGEKPVNQVGVSPSFINLAAEVQKGLGPTCHLVMVPHSGGPPACRSSSAPWPLLPRSMYPLLPLFPLPGIMLCAQASNHQYQLLTSSGNHADAHDKVTFSL